MDSNPISQRPSWDVYYLTMAFVVAQRSLDPNTKHGAIIVSKDGRVLSTGYNGPIKGSIDKEIPLTRPKKYIFFIHSEENSILAYNGSYQDIVGSTIYVTGRPCHRCLRMIIQKGITRIIHAQTVSKVIDQVDMDAQAIMLRHHPEIKIIETKDNVDMQMLLRKTDDYIEVKKHDIKPNYEEE